MKNIKTTLTVCIIVFLLNACQKPFTDEFASSSSSSSSTAARPKTYTEDVTTPSGHTVVTFNLSYDANNRLVSMISASSPGDKFIYQYSSNTITLDIYNSNVLNIHEIFFLNSLNYADSTLQYNNTADTMTEKYYYNSSNQLVKLNEYDYSVSTGAVLFNSTTYAYDVTGNVVTEVDNTAGTTTYTYSNIPFNFSMGFDFLPPPKYFVKTETNGSTLTHAYTFDSSNRLLTDTVTGGGYTLIKSYTY